MDRYQEQGVTGLQDAPRPGPPKLLADDAVKWVLQATVERIPREAMGRVRQRHRAEDFQAILNQIERATPKGLDLHLILDNSSTHKAQEVKQWLEARHRHKMHFTPASASWLNAVGRE